MARVTIEQIETKEFTITNKGYDGQEVDEFLDAIMDEMALMLDEIARLKQELAAAKARPVMQTPPPVQQEQPANNATKALEILEMAQQLKNDTLARAQQEADEILASARAKASEQVGDLATMRDRINEEINTLKATAADYRARFQAMLQQQMEVMEKTNDLF